ncbi:DUF2059 domain-containing protein [Rheinheimera sp. NSM]|uniref:DUF2059 domain-containing protein n=1 Tax=Rheinheimera sp. NSM TaxID=3457884 RepID=UPI004035C38F
MKRLIAGILCLVMHTSVYAESSNRQSIEELLQLTNADSMLDGIYAQMDQMFAGMGQQIGVKPSEQDIFDNFMQQVGAVVKEKMSWAKMKDPMIDIYLKHYTEKEVQDMLIFYRSATGRSLVEKMPAIMSESMMLSQKMMKDVMPEIQQLSAELKQELTARRSKEQR